MACELRRTAYQPIAPDVPTRILALAALWVHAGGSSANVVAAVSVALAESGGDIQAQSDACADGLWQIWEGNYQRGHVPNLFDSYLNASIAVEMSNDGRNWSAWDVAYAAGENLTNRYPIAFPEAGSAAASFVRQVSDILGMSPGDNPSPPGIAITPPAGEIPGSSGAPPGIGSAQQQTGGWDNLRQWLEHDTANLVSYDQALIAYLQNT